MAAVSCALALLSGVIGAGFASGREIVRFFAGHGTAAGAAVIAAMLTLCVLFLRLCAQLERYGCAALPDLCRARFGQKLGALCGALFALLCAVTGGAMLAACAELGALILNIRYAYALSLLVSLLLGVMLSRGGLHSLALPGAALCVLLPVLLVRLLLLPAGEACFLPAMSPDLPVRAAADGVVYAALNAAMLAGALPLLLPLAKGTRRRAVLVFTLLFGALLTLAVLVCRRHLSAVWDQPLPFVWLSRALGGGYVLVAACMYAAALSTFYAMLSGLSLLLPKRGTMIPAGLCLLAALLGFGPIVQSAYPVLGVLCAGLLLLLCAPSGDQKPSSSAR